MPTYHIDIKTASQKSFNLQSLAKLSFRKTIEFLLNSYYCWLNS